jgi:hypothetical protein
VVGIGESTTPSTKCHDTSSCFCRALAAATGTSVVTDTVEFCQQQIGTHLHSVTQEPLVLDLTLSALSLLAAATGTPATRWCEVWALGAAAGFADVKSSEPVGGHWVRHRQPRTRYRRHFT